MTGYYCAIQNERLNLWAHRQLQIILVSLNPAQQAAVETLSGPLLVLAGAGTGKTRVVTYRIARLIKSGIRPSRILAVTFTNKAANEMRAHLEKELGGKRAARAINIGTFHSICLKFFSRQFLPNIFRMNKKTRQKPKSRKKHVLMKKTWSQYLNGSMENSGMNRNFYYLRRNATRLYLLWLIRMQKKISANG